MTTIPDLEIMTLISTFIENIFFTIDVYNGGCASKIFCIRIASSYLIELYVIHPAFNPVLFSSFTLMIHFFFSSSTLVHTVCHPHTHSVAGCRYEVALLEVPSTYPHTPTGRATCRYHTTWSPYRSFGFFFLFFILLFLSLFSLFFKLQRARRILVYFITNNTRWVR